MSFFNFNEPVSGNFESGGGEIEPIPANTAVLAAPDEAKIGEYQGDEYVSLRWVVLAPKEYQNRKIFQKIRVFDADQKKAEKARRMLAAIDANAGGKLMKANSAPTDQSLTMALVNKPMVLKLQVWEIDADDGTKKRGNWISAVSPRQGNAPVPPVAAPAPAPAQAMTEDDFGDSVPF